MRVCGLLSSSLDSSLFPYENHKECVCGLLSSSLDSSRFPYENVKECVCVGSFPSPWIPHFEREREREMKRKNESVWAPSLLLGFLINFLMKTIRNACGWAPSLLLEFIINFFMKQ